MAQRAVALARQAPVLTGTSSRAVGLLLVGVTLYGCSGITSRAELIPRHMGIRPDEPAPAAKTCDEYRNYFVYAQELREAYLSRATQNRWWIYVAGILGLGTVAATGGLAAASAASAGTLALLTISGGFSSGVFATLDNSTLADIYTIAANKVDAALKEADSKLAATNRYEDQASCKTALDDLRGKVSEARTALEEARTDSAKAALQRAVAQQQALKQLTNQVSAAQQDEAMTVTPKPLITRIAPTNIAAQNTEVTLTVSDIRLDTVPEGELKVSVANQEVPVKGHKNTSANQWEVYFVAPALAAGDYDVTLIAGKSRRRVENGSSTKLHYP